jgi:hypothetical protein
MIPMLALLGPRIRTIGIALVAVLAVGGIQQLRLMAQRQATASVTLRATTAEADASAARRDRNTAIAANMALQRAITTQNAQISAIAAQRDKANAQAQEATRVALARREVKRAMRPAGSGAAWLNARLSEFTHDN